MAVSFLKKRLEVTFELPEGKFAQTDSNTLTLRGLRTSVRIDEQGGDVQGFMDLRIWGLPVSVMNDLFQPQNTPLDGKAPHRVTVLAGDEQSKTLSVVFSGFITSALIEYQGMPDVPLHIAAAAAFNLRMMSVTPSSFAGSVDLAEIMRALALKGNLGFENNGVTGQFTSNAYFSGSIGSQIEECAHDHRIAWTVEAGTLVIWPEGKSRSRPAVTVSRETGLVGFPTKDALYVNFTSLYNPLLRFGNLVKIETSFTPAAGLWTVQRIGQSLDAEMPGGAWFTQCAAWQAPPQP
jgi:hypothetical protein